MKTSLSSLIAAAFLLPATALAECPAPRDVSQEQAEMYESLKSVPNELAARPYMVQLWKYWTEAPDAHAQELLDTGMEARRVFDFERAQTAFDELVNYCPDYAEGYNQRAFVAFLRDDYATALEDLERTLERNPDHAAALAGLGLTLMRMGRPEASQSVFRQALELNPWLPERAYVTPAPDASGTEL